MALINCVFGSSVLGMQTYLTAILPETLSSAARPTRRIKRRLYPVLYLLHGLSGDHTTCQRYTSLERYVRGMPLVVVIPNVQKSFYADMAGGSRYWTFVSEELPRVAQSFFPISPSREDTFAAGISMGGYGAYKLGLKCGSKFCAVASISGALDIAGYAPKNDAYVRDVCRLAFGDVNGLKGGEHDLYAMARQAAAEKLRVKLYQACGTEDLFYKDNVKFYHFMRSLKFDVTFEKGGGGHAWEYWDKQLKRMIEWLPVRKG